MALLLLVAAPLILYGLGRYSLVNLDEDIYHSIAVAMVESGNWFHLDYRGEHRVYDTFMNAPIQYWVRAVLITLFGDNLWTMRIVSALFGVAGVLMTYRLASFASGGDRRAALLAGLFQATTFQFVYLHASRTGELDTIVTFAMALTAYLFLRAVEEGRSFVSHHVCVLAIGLVKLPVMIVPLAVELALFARDPDRRAHAGRWLRTFAWLAPLAFVWHLAQLAVLGDSVLEVVRQMLGEAAGTRLAEEYVGAFGNLRFYADVVLFGALPYALLYPAAIAEVFEREDDARLAARWRALAVFALGVLGFYVLVAKHYPWYILPAYPFLSTFLGVWIARISRGVLGVGTLVWIAAATGIVVWLDVAPASVNPFAERAVFLPMSVDWREVAGLGPTVGAPLTALFAGGLLALGWRSRGRELGPALAAALAIGAIAYAGVRVALPLRHLDHESAAERYARELDALRESDPGRFPVPLAIPYSWDVPYYLERDYAVVEVRDAGGTRALVYERGDPRLAGISGPESGE